MRVRALGRCNALATELLALSLLAATGCKRAEPQVVWVERVAVSEADVAGHPSLGIGAEELRKRTATALEQTHRLRVMPQGESVPDGEQPYHAGVELGYARALPGPSPDAPDAAPDSLRAEVGVELWVAKQRGERLRGSGQGRRTFAPGDPDLRGTAFEEALQAALTEAASEVGLQLEAAAKSDEQLLADLKASDPQRRDFAIRALADRRSSAAIPLLEERLADPDREVQLRAVGALVTVGDAAVVPALIAATAQKDPSFVASVCHGLGDLGGAEAEAYLFTASTGHPEIAVRRAAEEALKTLRENQRREASRGEPLPALADRPKAGAPEGAW